MTDKRLLWGVGVCFAAAAVLFWLWKLYVITGPAVHILILLFMALYGLFLVLLFALGCRHIFKAARSLAVRGFDLIALVVLEVCLFVFAALGMNFVGQ